LVERCALHVVRENLMLRQRMAGPCTKVDA
jgi:hypothetical protein